MITKLTIYLHLRFRRFVLHPLLVHNALYQPVRKVKQYLAAEVRSRSKFERLTDDRR